MVTCIIIQVMLALFFIIMIQLFQTHNFNFIMIGT